MVGRLCSAFSDRAEINCVGHGTCSELCVGQLCSALYRAMREIVKLPCAECDFPSCALEICVFSGGNDGEGG